MKKDEMINEIEYDAEVRAEEHLLKLCEKAGHINQDVKLLLKSTFMCGYIAGIKSELERWTTT